jgi:hypothetical protein
MVGPRRASPGAASRVPLRCAREQLHLMPMPAPFDGYDGTLARVSSTCLVAFRRNRHSVPCEWAGQLVSLRLLYPQRVEIVVQDRVMARHDRVFYRDQTRYDWQHYIDKLRSW